MTETIIRAPNFDFGAAVTQIFNLPGGKGYLFRVIGFASLMLITAYVLLGIPLVKAYVSMFSALVNTPLEGLTETEQVEAMIESMGPMYAMTGYFTLLYFLQYGVFISVETALYRNIIHEEDKGFFPLRFGGDECKVLLTRIVVAIILYALFFAVYFCGAIIGVIFFALGSAANSAAIMGIAVVFVILLVFGVIGVFIYAAIRLSPSAAFSVRDQDFTPIGSWGPMKTYFWPTFGAVLLIGVVGYFGVMIVYVMALGLILTTSGIFPALSSLEYEEGVVPDFSIVLDKLTSFGFIVPSFIFGTIIIGLGLLYVGALFRGCQWRRFGRRHLRLRDQYR